MPFERVQEPDTLTAFGDLFDTYRRSANTADTQDLGIRRHIGRAHHADALAFT
ncbi:hypothetical protein D9M68_671210 [compost metagenome]